MGKIKGIIKVAIIRAVVGAIIAVAICLFDTKIVGEDVYGEPIYRPAYPSLAEKMDALVDILPEWMLIGAVAVNLSVWMTGNNR